MAGLLELPSELLGQILDHLPLRSLLAFSEASRAAHALALSSLHTLSLGVYPTRLASKISQLAAGDWDPRGNHTISCRDEGNDHAVSLIIPRAESHDGNTLLTFHNALMSSVLSRYACSLRTLELSIWAMSRPIALALAEMHGLKSLSLRTENPYSRLTMAGLGGWKPRNVVGPAATEDKRAWFLLASAWGRLEVLRLYGARLGKLQLLQILEANVCIRELWLKNCSKLGAEIWPLLGENWTHRDSLTKLSVMGCCEVRDESLQYIGNMKNLRVSTCP